MEEESEANRTAKAARKALDAKVASKYRQLSDTEFKTLVVNDKWLSRLRADLRDELDHVSRALADRVAQLTERYATPLPKLVDELEAVATRVDGHLRKMGLAWT